MRKLTATRVLVLIALVSAALVNRPAAAEYPTKEERELVADNLRKDFPLYKDVLRLSTDDAEAHRSSTSVGAKLFVVD